MTTRQPTALVLTPSGVEFEAVRDALGQALNSTGFNVMLAPIRDRDQPVTRGAVFDTREGLRRADLVVGDISSVNASVMYQLGVADGMDKRTMLTMARDATDNMPADFMGRFIVIYEHADELHRLIEKFAARELETLEFRS